MTTEYDEFLGTASPAATVANTSSAPRGKRRVPAGERWEDRHVRRTYHLPVPLVERLDAAVAADDELSLSGVVTEAIEAWLDRRDRAARKGQP